MRSKPNVPTCTSSWINWWHAAVLLVFIACAAFMARFLGALFTYGGPLDAPWYVWLGALMLVIILMNSLDQN